MAIGHVATCCDKLILSQAGPALHVRSASALRVRGALRGTLSSSKLPCFALRALCACAHKRSCRLLFQVRTTTLGLPARPESPIALVLADAYMYI
jgi:hypothetical protein